MGLHRKVIRVRAEDSPNVRLGLAQRAKGLDTTNEIIVPGVLTYQEYCVRRATWDPIRQCIGLDGEFHEGAGTLMFPPVWLNMAEQVATKLDPKRDGRTIGVDCAEGGDKTAWAICDNAGLIKLESMQTPDTSIIPGKTIALMQEFKVKPDNVYFDRGGGGYEHVCTLKSMGYNVRAVSFAESAIDEPTQFYRTFGEKEVERHERHTYKNRRAQMYHLLRLRIEPKQQGAEKVCKFALPAEYSELRRQLAPIPLYYDEEGKIYMLPKRRKPTDTTSAKGIKSLEELLGCSPDEADALVLAVYALDPSAGKVILKPLRQTA